MRERVLWGRTLVRIALLRRICCFPGESREAAFARLRHGFDLSRLPDSLGRCGASRLHGRGVSDRGTAAIPWRIGVDPTCALRGALRAASSALRSASSPGLGAIATMRTNLPAHERLRPRDVGGPRLSRRGLLGLREAKERPAFLLVVAAVPGVEEPDLLRVGEAAGP